MRALVLGGNRFFGRHLAEELLKRDISVTLINRGRVDDRLGSRVHRIRADRRNRKELGRALKDQSWDIVFDQICYDADEARMACDLFRNKTQRYIFTSSQSIYPYGHDLAENSFNSREYEFENITTSANDYAEAKRQAEAVFANEAPFDVAMVRLPFVIGVDDYTERLKWHIKRCDDGLPIYFPNIQAKLGFIRSDQAGLALAEIGLHNRVNGPVNCAAPGPVPLRQLMDWIEAAVGKPATITSTSNDDQHSPYGVPHDWTMNIDRLASIGVRIKNADEWLPPLIRTHIGSSITSASQRCRS